MKKEIEKFVLPDGVEIYHLNKYETEFMYQEIFIDKTYVSNGINCKKDMTVVDIGGNIGMFSLYVKLNFPESRIYSFEPVPDLYEINLKNMEKFENVKVINEGVSCREGETEIIYYPGYSILSGIFTGEDDKKTLSEGIKAQFKSQYGEKKNLSDKMLDVLVGNKLREPQKFTCRLSTISQLIRDEKIEKIDLLKIDAEKSELDILNGIDDEHWNIIDQIVLEVHEEEIFKKISKLFEEKGFEVKGMEEIESEISFFNVYAVKK